jgi:hypothetical protein
VDNLLVMRRLCRIIALTDCATALAEAAAVLFAVADDAAWQAKVRQRTRERRPRPIANATFSTYNSIDLDPTHILVCYFVVMTRRRHVSRPGPVVGLSRMLDLPPPLDDMYGGAFPTPDLSQCRASALRYAHAARAKSIAAAPNRNTTLIGRSGLTRRTAFPISEFCSRCVPFRTAWLL